MSVRAKIMPGTAWALVLARGGSKGLPRKNLRLLGGQPLVAWAVAAGLGARCVSRVICSTDDDTIAEAATHAGAEIPFRRPEACATDMATDLDVFEHALTWFCENEGALPEVLVQLRPTTPFRDPGWIDAAIGRMWSDPKISCIRSVAPSPLSPYKMWKRAADGALRPAMELAGVSEPYNMPRQALPEIHWHTGQIDVIRTETILAGSMTGSCIHALDVPAETAVDIDTLDDFQRAEQGFERFMPLALRDVLAA